jgi:hypothetical protein
MGMIGEGARQVGNLSGLFMTPRRVGLMLLIVGIAVWPGLSLVHGCAGQAENSMCEDQISGPSPRGRRSSESEATQTELARMKVASALRKTMASVQARVARRDRTEALQDLSTPLVRVSPSGEMQVQVKLKEYRPEYVSQLKALGLRVEIELADFTLVQGWASRATIEAMASLDFVRLITPPGYPSREGVGSRNTQGDALLKADQARNAFGVSGAGVKVGVISDGVDHLTNAVNTGNVGAGVQVLKAGEGDEGTAMLEIVQDLAPGASLAFYGPGTDADMVVGINALKAAGARVVVDDLTFFQQSKFEDDIISQAQRAFATEGRVYVTAAGNRARQHYRSAYRRLVGPFLTDYAAAHDYGGGDNGNTLVLPPGCAIAVNFQWNNPLGRASDDFDLVLIRASDGAILDASVDVQNGTQDAFEQAFYFNGSASPVTVYIAILEFSLSSPASSIIFDYFASSNCSSDPGLQYVVTADSLPGNHTAADTVVVAAINQSSPGVVAPYSSRGPTTVVFPVPETRRIPNVSGIDCVTTQTGASGFLDEPFCGTSAAAPHLAALAALAIERNPGLTSPDLLGLLTATAVDVEGPGYDFASGFGRADALHAVDGSAPGGPVLVSSVLPASRSVPPGGNATAFTTIINAGGATATGVRIAPGLPTPSTLSFQETNRVTNVPVGNPDTPVNIPPHDFKTFIVSLKPTTEMAPTDVLFNFIGTNTGPAPTLVGVNSLLVSAANGVPDLVALAATPTADGVVRISDASRVGAFSVATVNVGATGPITASADTGGVSLPATLSLCQTDPLTAACITPLQASVSTTINAGATPTFSVFVAASGPVALDPARNRIFIRFKDAQGATRGASSVALSVQ